jgi:hypothetical protein
MAIIENIHMNNYITETFNASPDEINDVLLWRSQYLQKKREYNKEYHDKVRNDPKVVEAAKLRSKEWFQNNKSNAAARQKARYENDPEYKRKLLEYKKCIIIKIKINTLKHN